MAKKVYKSVTGVAYSFPVTVSETKVWIDCKPAYETTVTAVQSAIEAHAYFTSGKIALSGKYQEQVLPAAGAVLAADIKTAGEDYAEGDVITVDTGDGEKTVLKVTEVGAGGEVEAVEVIDGGTAAELGDVNELETTSTAGTGFAATVTAVSEGAENSVFNAKEFPEVTTVNAAATILKAEPYRVHHTKVRTPQDIMAQALEKGISFPNLVI